MQILSRLLVIAVLLFGAISPLRVAAADEPIVVVVKFFPTEGREDEAQKRLIQLAAFVPTVNPGVTFRLHRSTKGPTVFLMYEVFPSQAAIDNQLKTVIPAFLKEFGASPEGLFARPNEAEFYRGLGG